MERIDHLLHGCLADTAHEGTALARLLVGDYFKTAFKLGYLLHVGLAGVLSRYVAHRHHHAENHRKPVAGEKIARQYLPSEKTGDY